MSQGSDDGHAPAGPKTEGDLAASENSVINIFSNLAAPDKRTRDTAKLETEEPAPQRRRQIDPIKELLRTSKRVVRRKATQRKKKIRK